MRIVRRGALASFVTALLAWPVGAGAVTRMVDYGAPGTTQMPVLRGWTSPAGGTLRTAARTIGRSPASPAPQRVCVELTLYKYIPDYTVAPWAYDRDRRSCRVVAPGARARFAGWRTSALAYTSYNLNVTVTWRVAGGAPLASATFDYASPGDYRCQTRNCVRGVHAKEGSIRFNS